MKLLICLVPLIFFLGLSACQPSKGLEQKDKAEILSTLSASQSASHRDCLEKASREEEQREKLHRFHRHHFNPYLNPADQGRRSRAACDKSRLGTQEYSIP